MGMSASQARFLGLTARKTNVEFEGQQINQQRTTLSNQSANYYNDLLGMAVPVPPSVDDYTKAVYTFEDGALTNQITAMIAQTNGTYTVSYLRTWKDDFAMVSATTSIVNKSDDTYRVGSNVLRKLGELDEGTITSTPDTVKQKETFVCPEDSNTYKIEKDDKGYFITWNKPTGTITGEATEDDIKNMKYSLIVNKGTADNPVMDVIDYKDNGDGTYSPANAADSSYGNKTKDDIGKGNFFASIEDEAGQTETICTPDDNSSTGWSKTVTQYESTRYDLTEEQATEKVPGSTSVNGEKITDEYLKTLSVDQLKQLLKEEEQYLALLKQKYGDDDYMVRYVQNTTTGEYEPYFYKLDNLKNANYDANGNSQSNINCYKIGTETKTEEVKAVEGCQIEKDSSGRYISITIPDASNNKITYALTTTTATDQAAYEDAMNQYEYEKYEYDQAIQDINSKIEIIQSEDKNLELRLKQLDTEQDAISTEIDAVQKVIEKNVESSFKTFG